MPHIDEGALHAYLDGALDEYPVSEAEHVRAHLDVCAACRARLEAERQVRDRASAILRAAAPGVEAPPLEELRARARMRDASRSPVSARLYRLGWAASVVLAVGAGWLLRGDGVAPPVSREGPTAVSTDDERSVGTPGADAGADRAVVAARPSPPDPVRLDDGALLPSRTEMRGAERGASDGPDDLADMLAEIDAVEPPLPEAPRLEVQAPTETERLAAAPLAERVVTPQQVTGVAPTDGEPSTQRPTTAAASAEIVTSAIRAVGQPEITNVRRVGELVEDDDARDEVTEDVEESYSLVVPGLDVLDVRFRGAGVRPEGQIVLQRLASGDTLRVIHLPAEIALASVAEAAPQERQLVVQTASGWIVMRGRLTEDELVELMRRLLTAD